MSWQAGGSTGADDTAWLFLELMRCGANQSDAGRTWAAFIDGENAFCRPPPTMILRAIWKAGVRGREWRAVKALLGTLRGCLKLGDKTHGEWPILAGVPQGGALSLCLF